MEHKDAFMLEIIVEFCDRIISTTSNPKVTFKKFDSDVNLQDVSAFRVLQIGENVGKLSEKFKTSHPQIPWHQISGFRNVVAHEYGNVDTETLWKTIVDDIPKLRDFCSEQIA